jgi:hypothetical protein
LQEYRANPANQDGIPRALRHRIFLTPDERQNNVGYKLKSLIPRETNAPGGVFLGSARGLSTGNAAALRFSFSVFVNPVSCSGFVLPGFVMRFVT